VRAEQPVSPVKASSLFDPSAVLPKTQNGMEAIGIEWCDF
jgi:hypothetical protein